ncbi:MAG: efflux RND transporter periplasmic adaptor subunit [Schwartzia sp.]|nr:efflux RND transporter periplasmic adaptor subunit [Schwartzia sp. (in: firmicutes)]
MKSGKTRVFLIVAIVLVAIVGFRVIKNVMGRSEQASKSRQGTVVSVVVEHPKRQTVVPKIRFSGTLDPVWQADVAAKVDGRIERVLVAEGQAVAAGDDLVVLEQKDMSAAYVVAEGAYVDARTNLDKTTLDLQRYEKLLQDGAVSQESVDNLRFAHENAAAKLEAARGALEAAQSKLGGTTVSTPRAGIIQKRYYQEGYYAKVGTALFNIADISTLLAKIDVPEGYIASVAPGRAVDFTIPSMAGDDKTARGTITRVAPVADSASRTFEAEVSIDNHDGRLKGGVYADAVITTKAKQNVLTVPFSAIVMRDDQRTVYVVEDDTAVRRVVTTGYIGDDLVEILDGISESDLVIAGGQNKLRDGSKVKVVDRLDGEASEGNK